jgi:hypothetical protein
VAKQSQLVCQRLENMSSDALEKYWKIGVREQFQLPGFGQNSARSSVRRYEFEGNN